MRRPLGERAAAILARLTYKPGWKVCLGGYPGQWWIRVEFSAADSEREGAPVSVQRGRKWLLSEWMSDSEIVQTAFRAVLTAEEHECRELFRLDGVAVLGPHFDLFALAESALLGRLPLDARESGLSPEKLSADRNAEQYLAERFGILPERPYSVEQNDASRGLAGQEVL